MIGTEQQRLSLYEDGLNDGQIATRIGVGRSAIANWRRCRGLEANVKRIAGTSLSPVRRLLLDMGWGARSIARQEGVNLKTVRDWRKRHGYTATGVGNSISKQRGAEQLRNLQRRVVRAVGTKLPFDIAADAAAALMLAVIEGEVPLDQIESQGRVYGNRALGEYANAFKQQSLDEEIPGTDGLRGVDLLVDDSSSAWLEEMGATCH
ncbi:hypothetical protein K9B33_20820 [Sphingobium sp. 3R8]|uniref:hypothetical protein n=1 Tax=Sphingobium sp. 3R8 TaxID=2874921 RepID=UPI001CCC089D|nr:hypothetical protein [Sphingobium sp. 3R8]MBZ9649981.1 hypothetical protein [Sphingobium sp. 3R8]